MNGTIRQLLGRSVQLAVLATPPTSVAEAVAEARRRQATPAGEWLAGVARAVTPRPVALAS
jgi:hypothetical protein